MTEPVRLVLADDHAMFRAGMRRLLEEHHYAVIGEVGTGRAALDLLRHAQPDILLLDCSMPELTGLEVLGRLPQDRQRPQVIILSMCRHEAYVLHAFRLGADGYVIKDSASLPGFPVLERILAGLPAQIFNIRYIIEP